MIDTDGTPILPRSPDIERAISLHRPPQPTEQPLYCFPRLPKPQLGLSILIVDDNIDLLRLTATTLTHWGCAVFCASNAVAAMTFVCTVYKLPMQPLQVDDDNEQRSPREQSRELPRQSSGGSSPRNKSGLSVALPAKLDVIMIDFFLQPAVKKVDGDAAGNGAVNGDVPPAVQLNGMQLCRLIYKRLNQQQQRRMLKSANEVYIASSSISTPNHSPPTSTSSVSSSHASPSQLRRRLVNNTARGNNPSSRQPAIREEPPSPTGRSPTLARPHSLPDRGIPALTSVQGQASHNSSPLLHLDRLSLCISLNLPAFLLMVGLAEETSLASHHSPQKEACLSGKLRKPLAESQLRKVLEGIQVRQKEMEEDKAKQTKQPQHHSHQSLQLSQASTPHSLSLKELRSTSAPAQHVKPPTALLSPSESKGRPSIASRYPLKLLYAEDNVVNQRLLTRMLSKFGYMQVAIAENGQVALDMLEEERTSGRKLYELVFMDMQMPIKGGVEASTEIRQMYPVDERPFICGVTANAMESDRQKCLAVMDDYLSKPVSLTTLEQVLVKWGAKVMSRERRKAIEKAAAGGLPEMKEHDEKTEAATAAGESLLPPSQVLLHVSTNGSLSNTSSRSPTSTPSIGSPAALSTSASAAGASTLPSVASLVRFASNASNRSVGESAASTAAVALSPASGLLPMSPP